MLFKFIAGIFVAAAATCSMVGGSATFAISHCNDISGQFDPFELGSQQDVMRISPPIPCSDSATRTCAGGLINVVHWLHDNSTFDFQVDSKNILRLSSGNLVGGESGWVTSKDYEDYGRLIAANFRLSALISGRSNIFTNVVKTVGMKEFGAGLLRTVDYMKAFDNGTVTLSNACSNNSSLSGSESQFCNKIKGFVKIDVVEWIGDSARKIPIGIIGFVNPDVERAALPGGLKFSDVVESIKRETEKHKDIKTFIAVGDGNLGMAKRIIDLVTRVKVVLYSDAFLSGNSSSVTNAYPIAYKHGFIATAGRYGSAVGKMVLRVDESTGDVVLQASKLVVTNTPKQYNPEARQMVGDISKWRFMMLAKKDTKLGRSRVELRGGRNCWREECNFGNLITDAAVNCALQRVSDLFGAQVHSLWHAFAFAQDGVMASGTEITKLDVDRWLPYHQNDVHLVKVKGADLRRLFELSGRALIEHDDVTTSYWGQFLQVSSGIQVQYDKMLSNQGEQVVVVPRVTIVQDVVDGGGMARMRDLDDNDDYFLAIPTYLYEGRGVFSVGGRNIWNKVNFGGVVDSYVGMDDNCLAEYLHAMNVTSVGVEGRIRVNQVVTSGATFSYGGVSLFTFMVLAGVHWR